MVALNNYIIKIMEEKFIEGDWHYDHSKGRMVFGWQIKDCVLSGKGLSPLLSTVYHKKRCRWVKQRRVFFKSKIEIQTEHLTRLVEMGSLFFPV